MSRTHRGSQQSATTDFKNLGLHSGAANGNLGLVKFALDHGQPINSVLNGLLPIHAACVNGHVAVVQYLIERGADVNAPRYPRRLSGEKTKSIGIPVCPTGSTALHFAAAKGCIETVELLLQNGATVDATDKYGSTPIAAAIAKNHVAVVELLKHYSNIQQEERLKKGSVPASKEKLSAKERSSKLVKKVKKPILTREYLVIGKRRPSLPPPQSTLAPVPIERQPSRSLELPNLGDEYSRDDDPMRDNSDRPSIDTYRSSEASLQNFTIHQQFTSSSLTSLGSYQSRSPDRGSQRFSGSLPVTPYSNPSSSDLPMTPPDSPGRPSIVSSVVSSDTTDSMDIAEPALAYVSEMYGGPKSRRATEPSGNGRLNWTKERNLVRSASDIDAFTPTVPTTLPTVGDDKEYPAQRRSHSRPGSRNFWPARGKNMFGRLTELVLGRH